MGRQDWLDVDMDFFNGSDDPVEELAALLDAVKPSTPAAIMVEHHRVVAHVRRAVRLGHLHTPFTVLHVDEHHDFYHGPHRKTMDCGNFGYFLKGKWYDRFTWVASDESYHDSDWDEATTWLRKRRKKVDVVRHYPWRKRGWNPNRIGYATFAVSPDYLNCVLLDCAEDMVKLVTKHFGLTTTVVIKELGGGCPDENPDDWGGDPKDWGTARQCDGLRVFSPRDNIATGRLRCRPG